MKTIYKTTISFTSNTGETATIERFYTSNNKAITEIEDTFKREKFTFRVNIGSYHGFKLYIGKGKTHNFLSDLEGDYIEEIAADITKELLR